LLERLFERLGEGGPLDWGEVDGDLAARSIDEAAAEEGEASIAVEFGRDALTRAAIESAARDLKHLVRALIEMGRRYGFDQERSEWKFDGEGALRVPAIEGIEFALIGKVDRIDRARDGAKPRFVVFDYKSGGRELDPTKLVNGLDLQLPAYALALSGEGEVVGVFYWPMSIGLAEAEGESWAAPGTPEWFKKHRPAGLFRADAADLLDREVGPGGSSLAFGFARKKDGALKKTPFGHLPPEGMEAFLGDVRARMSEMAARIAEGRVEVAPWARKRERACELCDYAAVCRIGTLGASAFRAPKEMSKRAFFAQYGGDGVEDE
jgi:ATP-dependent helicase/nuclease subunit B